MGVGGHGLILVRGMLAWWGLAFDVAEAAVRWGCCGVCRSWCCAGPLGWSTAVLGLVPVLGWRSVGDIDFGGMRSKGCCGSGC